MASVFDNRKLVRRSREHAAGRFKGCISVCLCIHQWFYAVFYYYLKGLCMWINIVYNLIYEDITHLLCGRLYIMTQDLSPPCSNHLYLIPVNQAWRTSPCASFYFSVPPLYFLFFYPSSLYSSLMSSIFISLFPSLCQSHALPLSDILSFIPLLLYTDYCATT